MTRTGIMTIKEGYKNRNRNNIKFICFNEKCKTGEKGKRATFSTGDTVFKKVRGGPCNRETILMCLDCAREVNHI